MNKVELFAISTLMGEFLISIPELRYLSAVEKQALQELTDSAVCLYAACRLLGLIKDETMADLEEVFEEPMAKEQRPHKVPSKLSSKTPEQKKAKQMWVTGGMCE